ncbi:hypothetical protein GCM10011379_04490 [Filimonas zeae]|uniref:Uncharacterized protein n=2 Tax=Filimonas zeae TaxID=1737353 RepID=A0A917IMY1_9BACT|nr:hypothetical protein GCM10011379_04490 [Filimonas zeae]
MNKHFFQKASSLYPYRWFIIITVVFVLWEAYADATGYRIASLFSTGQRQWSAGGRPGVRHK